MADLKPRAFKITAYGYWGKPSATAVTAFDRLVFTSLSIRKGEKPITKKIWDVNFIYPWICYGSCLKTIEEYAG